MDAVVVAMNTRRSRYSDAEKPPESIEFKVRAPKVEAKFSMPYSTKPVPMIPVVTADMLQGATLCVDGYDPMPNAKWVQAFVPPLPVEKRK